MAETKTVVSKRWTLQVRDWLNGLWLAVIGGVGGSLITLITDFINGGTFSIDWKQIQAIGVSAVGFGLLYVVKRWQDPDKVITINPPKEDIQTLESGRSIAVTKTE